jgi:D-alanine-D-alanine ligase
MKILVLCGGDSPEREVSLRSAKSIAQAAETAGFEVIEADPKTGLEDLDRISKDALVFPILHGKNGEDGVIQKELEKRKLAFLGADSQSSAACFDKWLTHQTLEAAGVPMPKAVLVSKENYLNEPMSREPHVLKILHGGSSIGTMKIPYPEPPSLKNIRIENLFKLEDQAIVEELIEGIEITAPILDTAALPIVEILPPENEEFDYINKYNGRTQEICPPSSVSQELQTEARQLAEKVHKIMNCRHLSRVDIMIDKQSKLYVLEVNTMPGLTDQSLYPKAAAVAGYPMPQLVAKFADLVKRDYRL